MFGIPLDSPLWARLSTVYGRANELPALLSTCLDTDDAASWNELFNQVCHQGTPYGALWAVVPHLVSRLDTLSAEGWLVLLDMLRANVLWAPDEPPLAELKPPYTSALDHLAASILDRVKPLAAQLRERWRQEPGGAYEQMLLGAGVAAVFAKRNCAFVLDCLDAEAEFAAGCDACDERFYMFLEGEGPCVDSEHVDWNADEMTPEDLLPDVEAALTEGRACRDRPAASWSERDAMNAIAAIVCDEFDNLDLAQTLIGATATFACPGCGASVQILTSISE